MLTNVSQEFRRFSRNCYALRVVLKDTLNALDDIQRSAPLASDLRQNGRNNEVLITLQNVLEYCPAFVVLGQNCHSKAVFVNYLLGQTVLPLHSSNWRWIRLSYGHTKEISLMLGQEYEIVEKLKAHEKPWTTVPECDLFRNDHESLTEHCPTVEIKLNNSLLKDKVNVIIPPDCPSENLLEVLLKSLENILPVIVYVVCDETLSDKNIQEIRKIKDSYQDFSILFVSMSKEDLSHVTDSVSEEQDQDDKSKIVKNSSNKNLYSLKDQLVRLGYISEVETSTKESRMEESFCSQCSVTNMLISDNEMQDKFAFFVNWMLKSYLIKLSSSLSELHNSCLRQFILTAFDMAREIQITPRRIKYAQATEGELYRNLMRLAGEKQEEIARIIQATLQDMKSNVAEVLEEDESNSVRQPSIKQITMEIQQVVLHKLGNAVAAQLVKSVGCLHESFTGTLQRCLENLEKNCHEQEGNLLASDAVKQIITAAYNIELKSSTSFSVVHSFMERLRKLIHGFQMPWSGCAQSKCDLHWQLQIVSNMLDSLSSSKLAKNISAQFQEHVKSSHDSFQSAMRSLENQLSGKLEQTEEQRIVIRKQHAPRFARLALESTSLCDYVKFGMPKLGKEIGRGQYGVVYSTDTWGGINPCAIKSIVPPDDRHWNDLAMEFYYTRTIAEHPRIVKLRGSVIDHQYGGGCSPAVLLVMERMTRDLYCGIKAGLSWQKRLQIAIDVVEGIRYLHSQGLVHRDIKLKNVLLDTEDRAKLTDFGFCIPEAMMSGSIVGTPVHMAPELLSGHYDSSVDVYAFGILFWYICANQVRLPFLFEQFQNKEQLWTNVRKGLRPECLPHFPDVCWQLMEQCWAGEPMARPLLGYVQPQLEAIQRSIPEETTPPDP